MPATEKKVYDTDVEENKIFAALSYVWILCLIPLILKRKSKFAQFHARQGFVLLVAELGVAMIMWIPLFGQAFFLIVLVMAIAGFIKALSGESYKLPFIYGWSEKMKL